MWYVKVVYSIARYDMASFELNSSKYTTYSDSFLAYSVYIYIYIGIHNMSRIVFGT